MFVSNDSTAGTVKRFMFLITLCLIPIVVSVSIYEHAAYKQYQSHKDNQIRQQLLIYRTNIESIITQNLMLAQGLADYIAIKPDISQVEFEEYVTRLLSKDNQISHFGAARNLIISHIYPVKGNQAALGLDYRDNKQQFKTVSQAVTLNQTIIAGPLELVQGGIGLIGRIPIKTINEDWGVLSVVLNLQSILIKSNIESPSINVAIRGKDGAGVLGDTFHGTALLFAQSDLVETIKLPYGEWQIVGQASENWPRYKTHPLVWLITITLIILCFILIIQRVRTQRVYYHSLAMKLRSEKKFRAFFTNHTAPMLIIKPGGEITGANDAAASLYDYDKSQLTQLNISQLHTFSNQQSALFLGPNNNLSIPTFTASRQCRDGSVKQIQINSAPIYFEGQKLYFTILSDITERFELERKLKLDAQVFEYSQEGILITDHNKKIISINKAYTEITGYQLSDVFGKTPPMLTSGIHDELFYKKIFEQLANKGFWKGEIKNRKANGAIFSKLLSISKVNNDQGETVNYVIVFSDITKLKQSEKHLDQLAHYDTLTGLPNRNLLKSRLHHAIKNAKRLNTKVAVMFLDLDRFKIINDSLGHMAGDELLRHASTRLVQQIRETDTLARIGGDEFVVLLENVNCPDRLSNIADKLINELNKPFIIAEDQEVYIGASIGLSTYPGDATEPEQLVSYADAAMYKAKQMGRNSFYRYTPQITYIANEKLRLSTEIKNALICNQFVLFYQPQINLASTRIIGAEALIRWKHPIDGIITPDRFIDIAEDAGVIHQLTLWVIEQACIQLNRWQKNFADLTISVNISANDFTNIHFVSEVEAILDKFSAIRAEQLEFEIVENVIMENIGDAVSMLEQFRSMGISVAIDDFGTGYSSLSYLRNLPADKLKIDRSFIQDIEPDGTGAEIVLSAIGLAKNFHLELVAEGVELQHQADFLKQQGCQTVQGYLFGKPTAIEEFERHVLHDKRGSVKQ
ncbi:EAL domain-containing protein [Psychrobium sp. 1_MG-2023]|uniref:bifunctional diguanylate cyclase/phosphodiesterase n=1 Tax=Psychrobium sp. 1_MG-2023 TaxID=3062624 RepID=UPI000C337EB9|nr:EAL domain-containing protein [Psychrobium sp. 1_MG-2023]MDP2560271.1 EAL domain-containing protein [Psychrobium sp. 1_MG-2023]PKF55388.1 GGDEF domain-containing protein [Alteromonadales bacterium alter-6D02]